MPEVSMTFVKEARRARMPSPPRVLMWLPGGGQWVGEAMTEGVLETAEVGMLRFTELTRRSARMFLRRTCSQGLQYSLH